ncbi:hypothetical protein [Adlercreutzia caecimuris]|nr:hypothetical protein [Adlercreutzia caecimuris]
MALLLCCMQREFFGKQPRIGGADNYLVIATDGTYPFTNVIPYGE